ncbi:MAG TPA: ABC transporter permease [Firmicutes bacterium]|jgi:ribose transport system permease protein|nr:MAG: ribose ABC transporter permease [Peptococcaceae bacterium 1109]HHT72971.1 ABC transporter permease [Bacillota bacterium]
MSKTKRKKGVLREMGVLIALVAMFAVFTLIDTSFISIYNILDIINHSTINGLMAIGITFAILTGGNDLSIGSVFAIVIVVTGKLLVAGVHPILASLIGIAIGFGLGLVNGTVVAKLKLQPFVATLGAMSIYRGVAYVITGGWPVLRIPREFRQMIDGTVFNYVPKSIFILIGFALICHIVLKYTPFGSYIYAMGGNEEATRLSGVNVDKFKIFAYGMVGIGAALAGLVMLARLGTGEPTAGQGYELDAIAATAIGGASLAGGKGTVLGTFLGAILLSTLKVGLIVTGVDTFWQYIATGTIIVIAVYFEFIQSKLYRKSLVAE